MWCGPVAAPSLPAGHRRSSLARCTLGVSGFDPVRSVRIQCNGMGGRMGANRARPARLGRRTENSEYSAAGNRESSVGLAQSGTLWLLARRPDRHLRQPCALYRQWADYRVIVSAWRLLVSARAATICARPPAPGADCGAGISDTDSVALCICVSGASAVLNRDSLGIHVLCATLEWCCAIRERAATPFLLCLFICANNRRTPGWLNEKGREGPGARLAQRVCTRNKVLARSARRARECCADCCGAHTHTHAHIRNEQ